MQPKVAIIVPIYNVEKYLAACLDSIIHQSYKNLSIILIDDGSNDKSTEIAKEYFDKDYRITLICKSNGGQSSARNMGLEYISNGFTFTPIIEVEQDLESHRLPTFVFKATLKPNALSANNINYLTGEPLECIMGGGHKKSLSLSIPFKPIDYSINSCIIFSHTQTPPNDVEFLHFVDSDDMITPDCIATCMEHIGENDIVWHDTIHLAEDGIIPDDEWHKNLLDFLGLDEEDIRTPLPTIKLWKNLEKFHWVWGGVFRKKLCEKLRFSAQIRAQDALFGMILFAKAQSTLLITQKLYIYRLRANSTVDLAFSKSEPLKSYPAYMADIANTFNNNLKIKQYYFSYSIAYVCLGILAFIDTLPPSEKDIRDKLNVFISKYVDWAFGGLKLESDPRNLRTLLKPLEPYTKWVSSSKKLAYFAPYIFSILHTCKNILKRRF